MRPSFLIIGAALLLSACATAKAPPPEPIIQTQIVKEPVAVPCQALAQLGVEPAYADTDAALLGAGDIDNQVALLLTGRTQRQNRLHEYQNARLLCQVPH